MFALNPFLFVLVVPLIYLAGLALLFYIMILTIQALRLAILALKKYLNS
ncbi:MAG: hypothetical protein ACRDHZ_26775 [Ktedonobacteraceae bacterium]